jgi:hypothetical protein
MLNYLKYPYILLLPCLLIMSSCEQNPQKVEKAIKSSSYNVFELCNNPDLRIVDTTVYPISTKRVTSFNVKYDKSKDSIKVTFDFVAICCQEFDMQHIDNRNVLKILYLPKKNTELCECYCDYRAEYTVIDSELDLSKIRNVIIRRAKRTK